MNTCLSVLVLICLCIFVDHVARAKSVPSFVRVDNKTFYIGTRFEESWDFASEFCKYHEMELATIRSEEEQTKLEIALNTTVKGLWKRYWIGGTDLPHKHSYVWTSGEEDISYRKWYPCEPNNYDKCSNGLEHCMELRYYARRSDWMWNDNCCEDKSYFICEFYRPSPRTGKGTE